MNSTFRVWSWVYLSVVMSCHFWKKKTLIYWWAPNQNQTKNCFLVTGQKRYHIILLIVFPSVWKWKYVALIDFSCFNHLARSSNNHFPNRKNRSVLLLTSRNLSLSHNWLLANLFLLKPTLNFCLNMSFVCGAAADQFQSASWSNFAKQPLS